MMFKTDSGVLSWALAPLHSGSDSDSLSGLCIDKHRVQATHRCAGAGNKEMAKIFLRVLEENKQLMGTARNNFCTFFFWRKPTSVPGGWLRRKKLTYFWKQDITEHSWKLLVLLCKHSENKCFGLIEEEHLDISYSQVAFSFFFILHCTLLKIENLFHRNKNVLNDRFEINCFLSNFVKETWMLWAFFSLCYENKQQHFGAFPGKGILNFKQILLKNLICCIHKHMNCIVLSVSTNCDFSFNFFLELTKICEQGEEPGEESNLLFLNGTDVKHYLHPYLQLIAR